MYTANAASVWSSSSSHLAWYPPLHWGVESGGDLASRVHDGDERRRLWRGSRTFAGGDEGELVVEVGRVLDHAHHRATASVELDVGPDVGVQQRGDIIGQGDLSWSCWPASLDESEQRRDQVIVGVLRTNRDALDGSRYRNRAVADDAGGAEVVAQLVDGVVVIAGMFESHRAVAVGFLGSWDEIEHGQHREDAAGDRHGDHCQHQQLLTPFSAQGAPPPAAEGTPRAHWCTMVPCERFSGAGGMVPP